MKKKILTIFSGGTICTLIKKGVMDTNDEASYALTDFYKKSDKFSSKSDWRAGKCSLTAVKIAVKERGRFITN